MSFVVSATTSTPISSTLEDIQFNFTNSARNYQESLDNISFFSLTGTSPEFLSAVSDCSFNHNSLLLLTDNIPLSSIIQSPTGHDKLKFNYYSFDCVDFSKNVSTEPLSSLDIQSEFLIVANLSAGETLPYQIIPLKATMGVDKEYRSYENTRNYDALFFGSNKNIDYVNPFVQFKTEYTPITFSTDKDTFVKLASGINDFSISSSGFIRDGAIGGNCPANSDNIFVERFGYSANYPPIKNGVPLCIWLSASEVECNSEKIWLERWYDNNLVTSNQAHLSQVNTTSSLNPIVDIPSNHVFAATDRFTYSRFGESKNSNFVGSFSSNLICEFSTWTATLTSTVNDIEGFIVGQYTPQDISIFSMDGTVHGHIPPTTSLHKDHNITVNFWAYMPSWSKGIDTQLFGNFSNNEGYGIFYNNAATNSLITLPTNTDIIYGLNNRGFKVFEKNLSDSTVLSGTNIQETVTDFFGVRWFWDSANKSIIRLETDDIIQSIVPLSSATDITKMQINSKNELYILDSYSHQISGFDTNSNLISSFSVSSNINNFEITSTDTFKFTASPLMMLDNEDNVFKVLGTNIYKNDVVWFHIADKINDMKFDLYNNLWVLFGNNKIIKIDKDKNIVFQKTVPVSFQETNSKLCFVRETYKRSSADILWIIFNDNKFVIKLDPQGNIIKRIDVRNLINLRRCGDFLLTSNGDCSGFDIKRKFERNTEVISPDNPNFSLKLNVKCGAYSRIIQLYATAREYLGWVNFSFTHKIEANKTYIDLFVNGIRQAGTVLDGTYLIDYGSKVSPFIVGGYSGKLGSVNIERSLNNTDFFQGAFSDLKIYNNALDRFSIKCLSRASRFEDWRDMIYYAPCLPRTYLEEINKFHLNRYPGSKSNIFNLRIKGFSDSSVQTQVKNFILQRIGQLIPANTILNEIIFD